MVSCSLGGICFGAADCNHGEELFVDHELSLSSDALLVLVHSSADADWGDEPWGAWFWDVALITVVCGCILSMTVEGAVPVSSNFELSECNYRHTSVGLWWLYKCALVSRTVDYVLKSGRRREGNYYIRSGAVLVGVCSVLDGRLFICLMV